MNAITLHRAPTGVYTPPVEECGPPDSAFAYITYMLGTATRDKLMAAFGGTELSIPHRRLPDDHPITIAIGRDDADALVEIGPFGVLYVPHGNGLKTHADAVRAAVLTGTSSGRIARNLGISVRQVRRYRAQLGLNGQEMRSKKAEERRNDCLAMVKSGTPYAEIAEWMGTSEAAISRIVERERISQINRTGHCPPEWATGRQRRKEQFLMAWEAGATVQQLASQFGIKEGSAIGSLVRNYGDMFEARAARRKAMATPRLPAPESEFDTGLTGRLASPGTSPTT